MQIDSFTNGDQKTHLVRMPEVNWVILQSSDGVTVIDGGYPGHKGALVESLKRIGSAPEEIRAALLTHAHVDHLGGLITLEETHGFPVFADPNEVAHAHRDYLEQANAAGIAPIVWKPRVARWLSKIIPLGALNHKGIPHTHPFANISDLPGAPVAIATYGHTRGHSSFLVADGEIMVSGDALITGHPIAPTPGPQLLGPIFTHDMEQSFRSLDALAATGAQILLPGHGEVWQGPMQTAVDLARTNTKH